MSQTCWFLYGIWWKSPRELLNVFKSSVLETKGPVGVYPPVWASLCSCLKLQKRGRIFFFRGEAGSCDSPATSSVVGQKYPAICIHLRLRGLTPVRRNKVFGACSQLIPDPISEPVSAFSTQTAGKVRSHFTHIPPGKKQHFNHLFFLLFLPFF